MRFLRTRVRALRRAIAYALDPALVALEHRAIAAAHGILVLSEYSRGLVRMRHPQAADRVHVVGGAAADAFFAPAPDPEACRIRLGIPGGPLLFTSRRLEPRMGVDLLIDALPLVEPGVVLAVAGNGSMREGLRQRVERLDLQDRVRLLGHVSEEDLRSLYAAADLYVLPTAAYEGFGMSTVEALAAGTPVLGTAAGATPEIVRALGEDFVVTRTEPAALAAAVNRTLPLLSPELRARARLLAEERYRWDKAILPWETAFAAAARG
jgi:glycosyltransferase involved in cell wall biosynthesis